MPETKWQKSSFCGGGGNNCVEVRLESCLIEMRESEQPEAVITMTREQLAAFFAGVKAGEFDHLI
ncbi:DUF397 domain-containing protein [Streptomyces sp. ET3-23]|uniref:DUF397 domain-containing protein n=1 Tax=Streptomyces sp. ET3-23 TaxID=2885643 RepID=UPI001D1096A2|nr:DUF397 domain-containing protein [Streptomyces sp. ET3-23]MCC2280587.1 DUF397 domain-containing protein [Streptomyces sp. ET3-23]